MGKKKVSTKNNFPTLLVLFIVIIIVGIVIWSGVGASLFSSLQNAAGVGSATTKVKPTVSLFIASPTTINAGQSSTLAWSTSDATLLTITPRVGTVTGVSKAVTPTNTTTYTLSAGNAAGTTTATVSVTVVLPAPPKPTPTATSTPVSTAAAPASLFDDFSTYKAGMCLTDGSSLGPWSVVFAGFGCVTVEGSSTAQQQLDLAPKISTSASETHSALVVGPSFTPPFTYSVQVTTVKQLRTGSAPNAWEVGWVVWNYQDSKHFYYFIPKPNGWELGKLDPSYPGGQRFLATGSAQFPVGKVYTVQVSDSASGALGVSVDGVALTSFTDTQTPYKGGKIGFYTEDASVLFDNASVH